MNEKKITGEAFVERWRGVKASELATAQSFVMDLCELLEVERPHATDEQNYMFERPVAFQHGDGTTSAGRIDCYRRGAFVLEAKKVKAGSHTKGFDDALMRARAQAEGYARALPAIEGRPPFVVVVDVGHVIELYAEFTRSGATYTPFPDARSHRIRLDDLRRPEVLARLRALWVDPMSLDPSRASARVTREVAVQLAVVARSLEAAGSSPHDVAAFLARCLFSMFAEDVELLPRAPNGDGAFVDLLKRYGDDPATLQSMLRALWADMDRGGFSVAITKTVLRFNGKLFKEPDAPGYVLPLTPEQIEGLLAAGRANWREVEPAIFGTLLERALDPAERHALGAHYTPRAYVERLVLPTVVEPLRADWADSQAAALMLANEANALEGKKRDAKLQEARDEIKRFHHRLCTVRVLDPACGSGNFHAETPEPLKRLEGEVFDQLDALGESQGKLGLEGETVTLQQLRGIELNERAAALAELVLWIGFLQWHIRTFGNTSVAEPVVHDYGNIEARDAVLAYDGSEPLTDSSGAPVTRWDGATFKQHPVTGELVPNETARAPLWRYVNPQPAEWPAADFIVGNPPFIGNKRMREALGDGYVEALRAAWPDVPESADFVMYWWQKAADTVRTGGARRFGLITTNSLRQEFNRRVVDRAINAEPPLALAYVIPDHPWVDSVRGAAVRIAMTVGIPGPASGELRTAMRSELQSNGEALVTLTSSTGEIGSGLRIGADPLKAARLRSNGRISGQGIKVVGDGFYVESLAHDMPINPSTDEPFVRALIGPKDLLRGTAGRLVIDFFGVDEEQARSQFPVGYQQLLVRVKPIRDENPRPSIRDLWWKFAWDRPLLRAAVKGTARFIATLESSRHRFFSFVGSRSLLDGSLFGIALEDALWLGCLSSSIHSAWALATGGRLGVGNDPRYNNRRCFETFPFPSDDTGLTRELADRIRSLAERIDAHRRDRQQRNTTLTVTAMYNVLEKLRTGEPLTSKERTIHDNGLVSVLRALHDEVDAAVLAAYGWSDLKLPTDTDTLLERLVALNARRAAEEAAGTVRWLRPEFQRPGQAGEQQGLDVEGGEADEDREIAVPAPAIVVQKRPWPAGLPEQIKVVADVLTTARRPLGLDDVAAHFTARGRWRDRLPTILETLEALGRARQSDARWIDARPR